MLVSALALALAGCGGAATKTVTHRSSATRVSVRSTSSEPPRPPAPTYPQLLRNPLSPLSSGFTPAVSVGGKTAASIARTSSGVTLLRFDQHLVKLALHSGTVDAGTLGWHFGPAIAGAELRQVVAAFNGGFKLDVGAGGFESFGRTAVPLRDGLGSIVTYTDGYTDIGAWHQGVPAPGRAIASVRQNLTLLVDNGTPAATVGCLSCWGATLGGVSDPARSGLGVTGDGHLVWAGGEHLTASALASALAGAGVIRAVELDINPAWVAAYFYEHRGAGVPPVPNQVVPGQPGVSGQFLTPYSRDFFTVLAR